MDIFNAVMFSVVGLWLFVASLFDFRNREVPDWLNFSLLFVGIFSRVSYFVITLDYTVLLYGLFGFILTLLIGIVMSYGKQWGDGDSKMLIGIGTCFGFSFNFAFLDFNNWPILIYFFLNSMVMGAFYGLIWTIVLGIIHFKDLLISAKKLERKYYILPLSFGLFLFVFGLFFSGIFRTMIWLMMVGLVVSLYVLIFVKIIEKNCMYKRVEVGSLVPGDWVIETISYKGKIICSRNDRCLDEDQIRLLKKGKIKSVLVKEGVPFVPAFLFGFLFSLIFGNVLGLLFRF